VDSPGKRTTHQRNLDQGGFAVKKIAGRKESGGEMSHLSTGPTSHPS
jgi:hypothetical protein